MPEGEKVQCSECKAFEHTENIVTITMRVRIDGRNPKFRAQFCMLCWSELEPKLEVLIPAQSTGSLWEN